MVYIRSPATIHSVSRKSCPFINSEYTMKIDNTSWTHGIKTIEKGFANKRPFIHIVKNNKNKN